MNHQKIVKGLNEAWANEMGNIIRYLHHSFLAREVNPGSLDGFFRGKAREFFEQATALGDKIVDPGGHSSIEIPKRKEIGHKNV